GKWHDVDRRLAVLLVAAVVSKAVVQQCDDDPDPIGGAKPAGDAKPPLQCGEVRFTRRAQCDGSSICLCECRRIPAAWPCIDEVLRRHQDLHTPSCRSDASLRTLTLGQLTDELSTTRGKSRQPASKIT